MHIIKKQKREKNEWKVFYHLVLCHCIDYHHMEYFGIDYHHMEGKVVRWITMLRKIFILVDKNKRPFGHDHLAVFVYCQ